MNDSPETQPISRRMFLQNMIAGAAGVWLMSPLLAEAQQAAAAPKPYPFKLGLQSSSLRSFSLEQALNKTKTLGLTWWEGAPVHFPVTDDTSRIASYRQMLEDRGIKMIGYGVVDFTNDESDARSKFRFAKAMGVRTITASPKPDSLPLLDKLTQEFEINLGIHNGGPNDETWGTWQKVLDAMEGKNPRIGACDDTGQYLRGGSNPITAESKFDKRLYSIHLSSILEGPNNSKTFTPIGTNGGLLDVVQLLRFLKEHNYRGILAISDEGHPDDPMPGLKQSVEAMHRYITTVNTVTLTPGEIK